MPNAMPLERMAGPAVPLTDDNKTKLTGMLQDIVGTQVKEIVEAQFSYFMEEQKKALEGKQVEIISPEEYADDEDGLLPTNYGALAVRSAKSTKTRLPIPLEHHMTPQEKLGSQAYLVVQRMIKAIVAGRMNPTLAAEWYKQEYGGEDMVSKALAANDAAAGGFLVPEDQVTSVIELLRPMSVVRSMNPVIIQMPNGNLSIPAFAGGAQANYIGENTDIPVSQPDFRQVQLSAKKLAAIVPASMDLLRYAETDTQSLIRDDMVAAIAQRSDYAFIRGDGLQSGPKGLRHQVYPDNILQESGTVNSANVMYDLGRMMLALMENNINIRRPGWLMSPRTYIALMTALDANSNHIFKDEMSNGVLWGMPFAMTTQIPVDLNGSESELYLVEFGDVLIGETTTLLLASSTEAPYVTANGMQSSFSLDQMVIRGIVEHDMQVRHQQAIAVMTDVSWTQIPAA